MTGGRAWPAAAAHRHRSLLVGAVSVALVLSLWSLASTRGWVSPRVLPSPGALAAEVGHLWSEGYQGKPLLVHVRASVYRAMLGLFLAVAIGVPLGLLVGYSWVAAAALTPIFSFARPIPAISFIPLVILFFGIGEFPKVLLIFLTSMLYIILNTSAGVLSVPQELIRVGLNLGLTRLQLFRSVMFPASLPYVMTGIRTATAVSWALVVAAELVAAQEGLGYMVMDAATFFRVADVYISIGIIGAIGLALELVEGLVEARVLHWRGR